MGVCCSCHSRRLAEIFWWTVYKTGWRALGQRGSCFGVKNLKKWPCVWKIVKQNEIPTEVWKVLVAELEVNGSEGEVMVTLVQALRLCTGRTAYRWSRGIALPFHDHGTRRRLGVSVTHRPLFTPGKDPVPIVQEAGWAPGPVWTGAENLVRNGIRSPDRSSRSQSLYWLSCRAHHTLQNVHEMVCESKGRVGNWSANVEWGIESNRQRTW